MRSILEVAPVTHTFPVAQTTVEILQEGCCGLEVAPRGRVSYSDPWWLQRPVCPTDLSSMTPLGCQLLTATCSASGHLCSLMLTPAYLCTLCSSYGGIPPAPSLRALLPSQLLSRDCHMPRDKEPENWP